MSAPLVKLLAVTTWFPGGRARKHKKMNSVSFSNPRPRQLKTKQQTQVSSPRTTERTTVRTSESKTSEAPQAQCGNGVCQVSWRPSQQMRGASPAAS